jgi:hypothetical protein
MTTTINQKVANPNYTEPSSTFATDITVNGATVGRGGGNIASNLALGDTPFNTQFVTSLNTNNISVGNNNLNTLGSGVATVTILNGGSGYFDIDGSSASFEVSTFLEYVSGTPIIAGGTYPYITLTVGGGVVNAATIFLNGNGFIDTTTVFQVTLNPLAYNGSGFSCQTATLVSGSGIIAIGNNIGNNIPVRHPTNSIYIGNDISSTTANETIIGNSSTTSTLLKGLVSTTAGLNSNGGIFSANGGNVNINSTGSGTVNIGTSSGAGATTIGGNASSNTITIGGTSSTQPMTFGRSTSPQTINIASGVITSGTKTVNIGTGLNGTSSITNINVGGTAGVGTLTFGQSTSAQTVGIATGANTSTKTLNLGTGASSGVTNITIGATSGTSTTTVNGYFKPPALASAPTYDKGAVYFDTTLNKLRVGGATTWETITSV